MSARVKVGDLVRMKYEAWWNIRNSSPSLSRSRDYTDAYGIVYAIAGKGVKVFMPDGKIKVGLIDHYEIIQSV